MMRISKFLNFIALLLASVICSAATAQETYIYDKLGRLTQIDYEDGQVAKYNYDAAGNRTLVELGGQPMPIDDDVSTAEDTAKDIYVLTNDSDLNGDALVVVSVGTPSNGVSEIVTVIDDDWIRYTPSLNFNGVDSFTYTISDGISQATANITVTVVSDNDSPVAYDDSVSVNEDSSTTINPLNNDIDPDLDTLSIGVVGTPNNGTAVKSGTSIIYTPNADFNGTDSFVYDASDGALSDTGVITVTVNAVNDAPVAVNDTLSTNEDTAKTIDTRGNDTDLEGDSLTITSTTNGSKGSVAIVTSGTQVQYTPNSNQNGSDSFTYTISDGNGGTDTASVSVTIAALDDPPNAVNDSKSTNEDVVLTFDPRTNDIEPDGQSITITSKTNGSKGVVAIVNSGTQLRYTPNANQNGSDSFTYTVSDGTSSDTATVSMTVNAVNDPPTANNDAFSNVNFTAWTTLNVLANDSDIETSLTVFQVFPIGLGEVQIINGGASVRFRWLSPTNAVGEFQYAVSDGQGGGDVASVTVSASGGGGGGGGGGGLPPF